MDDLLALEPTLVSMDWHTDLAFSRTALQELVALAVLEEIALELSELPWDLGESEL